MPNFKKLSKDYEKEALSVLTELVKKQSVYDPSSAGENAPFGKGVKSALDYLAEKGKSYGFGVDACKGYCTELTCGSGEGPEIGIYAHADVVPAVGKWDFPPFSGKIVGEGKEAKMVSRGSSDDKGPLVAALMAVKLLKDKGLLSGYRVRLVAGGDEERGSSCLKAYFGKLGKKGTDYAFTPDADFPLIYGEKGIVRALASKMVDLSPIVAMSGGSVSNAVCDSFVVTLPKDKKLEASLKDRKDVDLSSAGEIDILTFKGKAAHGSTPEKGVNAALLAFSFLGSFYQIPFLKKLSDLLSDPTGKSFHGDSYDETFHNATWNYGVINYEPNKRVFTATIDYRFGSSADPKKAIAAFEEATSTNVNILSEDKVLLADKKGPLVSTLMKSYRRTTHRIFDKPFAIGGGTYAKEAPNCVAYGSAFKGHPGDIHSPNEYIYLEDLYKQIAIYADAIYSLGHLKK
ncbi:MAG TPA: hypothetical protein DEA63_00380 [Firmicutes bacterium]|nr:hypothetical protein [Bacillota bacterium]